MFIVDRELLVRGPLLLILEQLLRIDCLVVVATAAVCEQVHQTVVVAVCSEIVLVYLCQRLLVLVVDCF